MLKGCLRLANPRIEMRDRRRASVTVMMAHLRRGKFLIEMLDRRKRKRRTVKQKREFRPTMRDRHRAMKPRINSS